MRFYHLTLASFLFVISNAALAQDEDLIDDLPKARKEAAKEAAGRAKKPRTGAEQTLPPDLRLNTDLIDDLSPEQKRAAAERNAAQRMESAIPGKLDEALACALHNSPPILVADAKLRQAQAELNEVRLSIARDVTLVFQRYTNNKALRAKTVATEHAELEKLRQAILEDEAHLMYLLGVGTEFWKQAERAELPAKVQQRAAGGGMDAMMGGMDAGMGMGPGMMGMGPGMGMAMQGHGMGMGARMGSAPASAKAGPAVSEKVQKFLQSRVDLDFVKQPIGEVLGYLAEVGGGGVEFVILHRDEWAEGKEESYPSLVTLSLKQITMEAALQALADMYDCTFVFRDYGILVISPVMVEETVASFRAAGTPMIAPPPHVHLDGTGASGLGTPPPVYSPPPASQQ